MNSKSISLIKNKFKEEIKNKEILDIIIFGSSIKGNASPNDIDVALITEKTFNKKLEGFHISILNPKDFITNPPSLINTLLREGYSIKSDKPFSEIYNFKAKVMYSYDLSSLDNSQKVKIVNILRGKNKQKGFIEENKGEWLGNGIFLIDTDKSYLFEKLFANLKVKYKKFHLLIH